MKILLAASEVHPFAKTGGLADVCGALPRALARLGEDVAVCLPLYPQVRRRGDPSEVVAQSVHCGFANDDRPFRLLKTTLPGEPRVTVFLVENPWFFEAEDALYGNAPGGYGDGHLRFLYFSRAILKLPSVTGFVPDVVHLNDWQTALVAPLLRTVHRDDPDLRGIATVLTIHNMAYQGVFPPNDLAHAGLPGALLAPGKLLEQDLGNLLAGGIRFADALSTVSRSYAREILTPEYGHGLDPLLLWRKDLLVGIVNGLDTEVWNPSTDPHLPAQYSIEDLSGKAECRRRLLLDCRLAPTDGPIFGVVSRLTDQKGLDLVPPAFEELVARDPSVRLVVLGSGEPKLESAFELLARRHPERVHARLKFDAPFSSLVEAGSDVFLMPSRFEPCGLNQLISMQYGTPPVVRRIGGLRDTVTDATRQAVNAGRATGFTFQDVSVESLRAAMERALVLFRDPERFARLRRAGMTTDWSWDRSAQEYVALYQTAIRRRQDGHHLDSVLSGLPEEPLEIELPSLAAIPESYARDSFFMVPADPTTIFCIWELGGPVTRGLWEHLDPRTKDAIDWELVLTDDAGQAYRWSVGGLTRQWFARVPGTGPYRGEIVAHVPGNPPRSVLEHAAVRLPRNLGPDDA